MSEVLNFNQPIYAQTGDGDEKLLGLAIGLLEDAPDLRGMTPLDAALEACRRANINFWDWTGLNVIAKAAGLFPLRTWTEDEGEWRMLFGSAAAAVATTKDKNEEFWESPGLYEEALRWDPELASIVAIDLAHFRREAGWD